MATEARSTTRASWTSATPQHIPWVTVFTYSILSLGAILMVFPFVWMALSAFKQPDEIIAYPPILFSQQPTLDAISRVWVEVDFKRFFANSFFVASIATTCQLLTSALVGYVIAKYRFLGRNLFFMLILSTMMVPWPVLIIPQYLVARELGLLNSFGALILPSLYSAFGVFLMRQFMHSIPNELIDAARIDGASEPGIFIRVILPLTGPALAALGIFHFMWHWDSFVWPLIVISKEELYTLPLGLAIFQGQYWTDYVAVNAGALISVLPVLVVFLLLQRRFIEGIALTGMKG